MEPSSTVNALLDRLEGLQRSGNGWRARCPACGGRSRKLSIAERDGRVLVHCFDCSDAGAVLEAVGLRWSDLQPPRNWPLTPDERKAAKRAIRDVGLASAVDVLATEAVIAVLAVRELQSWRVLSAEDDQRLALACDRIGKASVVLTGKEQWRPDYFYPPKRLVAVKRGVVDELRRELGTAERELAAAEQALLAHERKEAA